MTVFVLFAALAAQAAQAVPVSPTFANTADARCIVVAGYAGAHGTPEQAAGARSMIAFFLGRVTARTPGVGVADLIARAAADAGRTHLDARAEGARCEAEFRAATAQLAGVGAAASPAPPPSSPAP